MTEEQAQAEVAKIMAAVDKNNSGEIDYTGIIKDNKLIF